MTKTKISIIALLSICLGVIINSYISKDKVEYIYVKEAAEEITLNDIIVERTTIILNSDEFRNEITALATARALYQLSLEKQDSAIDLSTMALESYKKSKLLAENWINYE